MASSKSQQIRSLSLPSKLNPVNQKIETELKRLRKKEELATSLSESILIGVSGLGKLYECINQALNLPLTQQALSLRQHENHVGESLKGCSSLVNVCSSIMEVVQLQGAITKVLESSLSESKQDSSIETDIDIYNSSRKEVIRKAKEALVSLNRVNSEILGAEDSNLPTVIKSLRCVTIINLSVLESLLCFLSMPVSKPKKSLVSKLMNKGTGKCASGNEMTDVDNLLFELVKETAVSDDMVCFSLAKFKALVGVMDSIESSLEKMCKQLTETKAYLMKIVSF